MRDQDQQIGLRWEEVDPQVARRGPHRQTGTEHTQIWRGLADGLGVHGTCRVQEILWD